MTVARTTAALVGTSESSLATVANNTTTTSAETDMFGNDTSEGWCNLYLVYSSVALLVGTLDLEFYPSRVPGQAYSSLATLVGSYQPTGATQMIYVNQVQSARYMTASVTNNATGQSASVFFGYELFQES